MLPSSPCFTAPLAVSSCHETTNVSVQRRRVVLPSLARIRRRRSSVACSLTAEDDGSSGGSSIVVATEPVPGTPCFTEHVSRSPMSREDRETYLNAAAVAFDNFLSSDKRCGTMELLVPQLDTSSDVYCRRFVLQLAWTLAGVSGAERLMRTVLMVQAPNATGATPLSVAGLARQLNADWSVSQPQWPEGVLSLALLDAHTTVDDDVAVVIFVLPTNAVDVPTVQDLQAFINRAPKNTRFVSINPRLGDVPGHSGVMGVQGRAGRIATLDSFVPFFVCRLLYTAGTVYPVQGVLYHGSCDEQWQVWRADRDEMGFQLIAEFDSRPNPAQITDAFAAYRVRREKAAVAAANATMGITNSVPLPMIVSGVALCAGFGAHFLGLV